NCLVTLSIPATFGGSGAEIRCVINGPDLEVLEEAELKIMENLPAKGITRDLDSSRRERKPNINIRPNRTVLQNLGMSADELYQYLLGTLDGIEVGDFRAGSRTFDIRLKNKKEYGMEQIYQIAPALKNDNPLGTETLANIVEDARPVVINRYDKVRTMWIYANTAPGMALGPVSSEIGKMAREALPPGYGVRMSGSVELMNDTAKEFLRIHGHTIAHNPAEHFIYHLGDAQSLANTTGVKIVSRFRQADILSGGQGAPLSAVYHQALSADIEKPVAFVDIGGLASITWIGSNGELMAFDAGPGNIAINDWVFKHAGQHMDYNGQLAAMGNVQMPIINQLMRHKFIAKHPPKAADKDTFKDKLEHLEGLSLEDGAATATSFVAEVIAYSMALYLPEQPKTLIVCGGGAKNPTLVRFIRQRYKNTEVKTASEMGWDASAIEAQAFAYLAARRVNLMPATYPFTTGVSMPCICGEVFEPK
ncbi:MAG: anhydro-N-acetylmuramic acid kinase, partial [Alphaproteobacteria bacterium]|nr:anhydro-N-acetylmuramic acid kinase [Alphaproteobacteria bacterium]